MGLGCFWLFLCCGSVCVVWLLVYCDPSLTPFHLMPLLRFIVIFSLPLLLLLRCERLIAA